MAHIAHQLKRLIPKKYLRAFGRLGGLERLRFQIYAYSMLMGILVCAGFSIYHFTHLKNILGFRDILVIVVLAGSLHSAFYMHRKTIIYTATLHGLILLFLSLNFDGEKHGAAILWMYLIPPLAFFLLGHKAGLLGILFSFVGLAFVFLQVPVFSFTSYQYSGALKFRFTITYISLCLFCFLYELVRDRSQMLVLREQTRLQQEIQERQRIEVALQRSHDELERRVQERTAELAKAKEAAEVANLAKSNFLSSISHELRTPLNHVLGFSEILAPQLADHMNEKQRKYCQAIHQGGEDLLSLINDILDLSRIDLGDMALALKNVYISALLRQSITAIRAKDLKPQLTISVRISPEFESLVLGMDQTKIRQVLFNLLSNAVKFTPDNGAIVVECARDDNAIIIRVQDTGIGIAPEHLDKIFEPFFQVKGGLCDKTPGVGLGLPLARRLIELHGGKLWVESHGPGSGSCFSFSLPIRMA